ncbi:MAG: hypothetical protein JJD98_18350 [Polaromonas sp.]|nr:hypothetical protein [Polaromonas sp.]
MVNGKDSGLFPEIGPVRSCLVGSQNSCKKSSRKINNFCSGFETDESKILKNTAKILLTNMRQKGASVRHLHTIVGVSKDLPVTPFEINDLR